MINSTTMKNSNNTYWYFFLIILLYSIDLKASDQPVWLSNVPPADQEKSVSAYGMHRLCSMKGRRGSGNDIRIIQWVRKGNTVEGSDYISLTDTASYQTFVFSPGRKRVMSKLLNMHGKSVLEFVDNEEGYYNAYLIVNKMSGDTLYVDVAKAELLSHSCRNGHKNVRKAVKPKIFPGFVPFEIIRKRKLNENFHFFISSGDQFTYQTLLNGKPVPGVPITLCTKKGWCKREITNKKGEAEFRFIQDYFTHWGEINKRKIYYYLIYSEYTIEESSEYQEQPYRFIHYSTTLSDGYFPAKTMYLSMVWGLIVFVVSLILIVAGIIIFRERRKKPYKEYTFDERANKD